MINSVLSTQCSRSSSSLSSSLRLFPVSLLLLYKERRQRSRSAKTTVSQGWATSTARRGIWISNSLPSCVRMGATLDRARHTLRRHCCFHQARLCHFVRRPHTCLGRKWTMGACPVTFRPPLEVRVQIRVSSPHHSHPLYPHLPHGTAIPHANFDL